MMRRKLQQFGQRIVSMALCFACRQPTSSPRRGIDGEIYCPEHVRTGRNL